MVLQVSLSGRFRVPELLSRPDKVEKALDQQM